MTSGRMMASFGLKVNGKIFVMMVKGAFVAKMPRDRVTEFVESGIGEPFDPRGDGRAMKEWITIKGEESRWRALAKEAHAFVRAGPSS